MPKIRALLQSEIIIVLSLIVLAGFILFWRLGEPSLKEWDEAIYAEISKEILQSGNWIDPQWDGKPWLEKPPLTLWLTAILYRLFGVNEFWSRAVSSASAVGIVILIYLIGKLIHARICGLLASLILLTTFDFIRGGRLLNTDVLLVFFIYSAIYFYLRLRDGDQRWWYLISISCALAFMVKDFAGLITVPVVGLALVLDGQFAATIRSRHFWLSLLVAFMIVAPWHIRMYQLHGHQFIDEYFTYHVFTRAVSAIEGHKGPYSFYLDEIMGKFHPWWVLMPLAVISSIRNWAKGLRPAWVLTLVFAVVLGFYTAVQTKHSWYILPLYPAMALLVGHLLAQIYNLRIRSSHLLRWAVILLCVGFSYAAIGKIRPYYVKMEDYDLAIKELSLRASRRQGPTTEPLLVFSTDGQLNRQGVLFYSGRTVRQATTSLSLVNSGKRYQDFFLLSDLVAGGASEILLKRIDVTPLLTDYEIDIIAESGDFVYARIRQKANKPEVAKALADSHAQT